MYTQVGSCPKCGAAMWAPTATADYAPTAGDVSCSCNPGPRIVETSDIGYLHPRPGSIVTAIIVLGLRIVFMGV